MIEIKQIGGRLAVDLKRKKQACNEAKPQGYEAKPGKKKGKSDVNEGILKHLQDSHKMILDFEDQLIDWFNDSFNPESEHYIKPDGPVKGKKAIGDGGDMESPGDRSDAESSDGISESDAGSDFSDEDSSGGINVTRPIKVKDPFVLKANKKVQDEVRDKITSMPERLAGLIDLMNRGGGKRVEFFQDVFAFALCNEDIEAADASEVVKATPSTVKASWSPAARLFYIVREMLERVINVKAAKDSNIEENALNSLVSDKIQYYVCLLNCIKVYLLETYAELEGCWKPGVQGAKRAVASSMDGEDEVMS